jgi:hypothetical protein
MKKSRRFIASLALSTLVISCLKPVAACGPFTEEAILSYSSNPDLPLKKFLDGELGVIRPTWNKSYLVVAYRTLSDKPFTSQQRDAVYRLWRSRIQTSAFSDNADSGNPTESKSKKLSSLELWMKERDTVPDTKPVKIEQERSIPSSYDAYLNCPDNSFDTATDNLKKKISKHGVTSAFVKDWVSAQDLVFCHCGTPGGQSAIFDAKKSAPPPEPPFPSQATDSKDSEARQDRAYQNAAALFYAEQYDRAFKEFGEISNELNNPYAKISRYMMPRCLIRKATMTKLSDEALHSHYVEAEKLLRTMIADSSMAELKRACEDLLGFVLYRNEPENRLKELSVQLVSTDSSVTQDQYFRSFDDYTRLLDSLEGAPTDPYETKSEKMAKVPTISKDDDLTNWIVTWERNDSSCFSYAVDRWHQTHSPAWLLAAMHVAPLDKKQTDELLQAAGSVPPESSAYLSVNYESARLHILRKEIAEAIKECEDFKSVALKRQLWSAANLFMDLRGKAPIDVSQFVENSVRVPAIFAFNDEYLDEQFSPNFRKKKKADFVFGIINAAYLNERVPLKMLVDMSTSEKLPAKLRVDAEQATWVRAVLLNDYSSQDKLLPALQRDYPKLASLIKATATGSEADRKFASAYLILKNPGMRPYITAGTPREEEIGKLDTFSDNWWNSNLPDQNITYTDGGDIVKSKVADSDYPNLLTPAQSKQGLVDKKQLLASGAGPTFLCTVVADYAASHKSDPRVPEALHLAVRASHYGAREKNTTPQSKKCFNLLHTNYPKSPYTANTPYYY